MEPTPLRGARFGEGNDDESPEALLISAFLEEGSFEPDRHHIRSSDIEAWRKLWDFCMDYQDKAGVAPPMSLVAGRHPEFTLIPDVSTAYAADQVRQASDSRAMRLQGAAMVAALKEEDLAGAYAAIEKIERPRGFAKPPVDIFDHATMGEQFATGMIEVPYPSLQHATRGGIGMGELWYLAARLGQGKTWELAGYAARAASTGVKVGIASLEMPAADVALRVLKRLCGRTDTSVVEALDSQDPIARKQAQDYLLERTPGAIGVYDPSHGRINTLGHIHQMCLEYDLVVLDHVGLMQSDEGRRAVDDWRVMALISNTIREITLSSGTPVLAAAQINREGENLSSARPPKASNLAQSDALGQDADVVVTFKRLSQRTMVQSAEKVRNGPGGRWYTRFEPKKGRFEEIDFETALDLQAVDGDL